MDALKSLVQPLVGGSGGSMIDGVKLVVLGGTVETARRMASSGWSHFINSFFLTAHFSEEDYPYDWLMLWLSRRPEWQRSREFETTTRTSTPGFSSRTGDNSFGDDEENDDDVPGKVKTRVVFQPTPNTTHTIYYRGHWLRVRRTRKQDPYGGSSEVLSISVVARNNSILKQLVLQAKKEYEAEAVHRIQIYFADSHGCWRWTDSRHKRPMSSIVLNPGVKEMLLSDTKDFLKSEKWYADRGIPFRRGYLLHGVPGSGKSSLIHAIAGELMLDIYVVSLSSSWINDSTLTTLMGRVPARCIVLLEDLDAAFTRSSSRRHNKEHLSDVNTLSLSGLLNALDGVAASEGRILFATTNHLERLDPALSRPGRMDVWVEFRNASKWQAELLFRNFFPSSDEEEEIIEGDLEGVELPMPPSPSTSSASSTFSSLLSAISPATSSVSSWSGSSTPLTPAGSTMNSPKAPKANPLEALKNQAYLPPAVEEDDIAAFKHTSPPLDGETLSKLAKEFADSIPDEEFSVAALQGYLLKNKSSPEKAASIAAAWVVEEREMRERLKKERELKEKQAREKRRQELLEQAADKKKAEEEAAKLAAAGQTAAVITDIVVPVPAPPALPVVIDIEENKENASQDDQSDSESSSGSRTPGDEPAPWIQVDN